MRIQNNRNETRKNIDIHSKEELIQWFTAQFYFLQKTKLTDFFEDEKNEIPKTKMWSLIVSMISWKLNVLKYEVFIVQ